MQHYWQHIRGAPWADWLRRAKEGGRRTLRRSNVRKAVSLLLAVAVVAGAVAVSVLPQTTTASYGNLLNNGGFENGFSSQTGCGSVGSGWGCFTSGGGANYGFYDDQWAPVVAEGSHSQLIEINTNGIFDAVPDRYAGIYQTVRVRPWEQYRLSLRGMIRTTNLDGDPWRYSVQVGWTWGSHPNWGAVSNWQDVGWNTYYPRLEPGVMHGFDTGLKAESDVITIYVRALKKWGVANEEIDVNLDAIALTGPDAKQHGGYDDYGKDDYGKDDYGHDDGDVVQPIDGKGDYGDDVVQPIDGGYGDVVQPIDGKGDYHDNVVQPIGGGYDDVVQPIDVVQPVDGACYAEDRVYNGGFEAGFNPIALGHVGKGWGYFTNGGAANYGFYDDQWPPVVAEGKHSQLIEINTKGVFPADGDRFAGIYQQIGHLKPGQTYELTVKGMLRGAGNDDDPHRFEAQWGYNADGDSDWTHVKNWTGMDLGEIYPRTEPGAMGVYRVRFTAPAKSIVLFVRGWSKWGISELEFDLNVDAIQVRGCGGKPQPPVDPCKEKSWDCEPVPPIDPCKDKSWECEPSYPVEPPVEPCFHIVKPGQTLSGIAASYGTSVKVLMKLNDIWNPDIIFVGQKLKLPNCGYDGGHDDGGYNDDKGHEDDGYGDGKHGGGHEGGYPSEGQTYVVRPGDTLSEIAVYFGVTLWDLMVCNGISDPDFIYVGQILKIP
jgi:LysM repeat protein